MNEARKNIGLIQIVLLICLINTVICHYVQQDVNNNTEHLQHHRSRRDLDRDEKLCAALDKFGEGGSLLSSIAGSAPDDIPGKAGAFGSLLSKIPVIGEIFDIAKTVITFGIKSDYLETDCSDIPFERIKQLMTKRFDKLDAKVDRNFVAINQLYMEIHRLYNEVTLSIKDARIQPILSGMKMFIEGFSWYQSRIDEYFNNDNFREIENVLEDLRDAIKRIGGQLSIQVNDILNQNFAVPEDGDDHLSILALHALYYGVQAHISVMLFLLEKRTLLAEYYYKNLDIENYHNQLNMMTVVYSDLKALRSKNDTTNLDNNVFGYGFRKNLGEGNSLIDRFYTTADLAIRKIDVQRRDSDKALKDSIHEHIEALKKTNDEISQLVLSIIKQTPHLGEITIKNQVKSGNPVRFRVMGNKNQVTVTYAMQYKSNSSSYFLISDWSVAYTLGALQYAEIELPTVKDGTTRLIFRQISSGHHSKRPELVGIIDNPKETLFKDIHRDLYNAAWTGQRASTIALGAIKNGADVNGIFENGRRPLHAAAEASNIQLAQALLDNGGNINVQDENGYTPLYLAAKLGHSEFCEFLISRGADGSGGLTPLHVAVIYNQLSTVKVLIRSSIIDVNLGDKNGDTPLHYAVNISQSAVEAMLENRNVEVNAKNNKGLTPLHYAVANKAENIVSTLLSTNRLDVNVISNNKMSPLHLAILDSSSPMTKFLLDNAGVNVDIEGPEGLRPIHFAAMTGNVDFTKLLIQQGANLAAMSKTRWTPLHFAIALRHTKLIYLLLNDPQAKDFINTATDEGYTALHMAASAYDDIIMASHLIGANGANINAKTNDGLIPLHVAAIHNKKAIAIMLLQNNNHAAKTRDGKLFWELAAAKNSVDVMRNLVYPLSKEQKKDLLNIAAKKGSLEVLKYAIEEKKFETTENDRQDILYTSIVSNNTKTAIYLINNIVLHADSGLMAFYKKNHIFTATKNQNLVILQYIINTIGDANHFLRNILKATFDYVDENGKTKKRTALHQAVYSGNKPLIKYLIAYSNFNLKDDQGKTAADVAKEKGLQDIYRIIKYRELCQNIAQGKKFAKIETDFVKSECYDNGTRSYTWPLHLAITNDHDIADELLEKGADVNSLDDNRNTPLHLALAEKKFKLAEIIIKKNPDVRIKNNKKEKPIDVAREHGASEELIEKIEKLEHALNVKDGFPN